MNSEKIKLFLVDDDALFLKLLEVEFTEQGDYVVKKFATGELCIGSLAQNPDIIILDYFLNGIDTKAMNGIETLTRIKVYNADIPVIMLSAQDKIEVAISCMHHKAYDYVVKSETAFTRLQKIIPTIFRYKQMERELNWYMAKMES